MNLRQLYYFRTIAELEHYTRAAEKLFVSQSSLSHAIQELESELNVKFFEKKGRNVELTKYGQLFLPYVQKSLATLEAGIDKLSDYINPNTGTVVMAGFPSLAQFAPDIIVRYVSETNRVDVRLQFNQEPTYKRLREQLLAYTGQDFQALVTEIRIRNACVLLGLKTPTLKYIAHNTGFGSVQTFYRAFQNYKGMTPEEYRKRHWMESEGKAGYLMCNNEIWQLLTYLHLHFDEPLTPESVAHELGISTSNLHKTIKYNLMESFSEILREIRINYACGLLMNPGLSVEQVAVEAGYNNSKTFIRAFQAEKGCTPSEFRSREPE